MEYRSSVRALSAGKVSRVTRQRCSVAPAPKLSVEQKSSFPLSPDVDEIFIIIMIIIIIIILSTVY